MTVISVQGVCDIILQGNIKILYIVMQNRQQLAIAFIRALEE